MQLVEIVADRFAVVNDHRAIDLATGAPVVLKVGVGGGAAEQTRWSIRCDGLHKVRHPRLAALVDYGALGESQRFEAWQCGPLWRGAQAEAVRTLRATSHYLRACGLTDGGGSAADVHEFDGRAVVVPGEQAGYLQNSAASTEHVTTAGLLEALETLSPDNCAMCTIHRRVDGVLADLFSSHGGSRPHIISMWGLPGSGRTTAALHAARAARLNGFVPIGVQILSRIDGGLVKDRHLCIISDHDDRGARWRTLLGAALVSPRVHVLLRIGRDELPGVHGVGLDRIPPDTLAGAVRPVGLAGCTLEDIKRAATMARGLPARFTELLWRDHEGRAGLKSCATPRRQTLVGSARGDCARVLLRVAEQPSVYGVGEGQRPRVERRIWPAPGELAALRRRSETAVELLKKGRHEPGRRQLRQAIGSLSRRGDWAHVIDALLALASALLARGEAQGALTALDEARACGERMRSETALIDVAILSGHAWIDLARVDEAESVIGTALAVARRVGDVSRGLSASLALGRCLFWKGEYADARSALALPTGNTVGPHLTVPVMAAAARAAVGMGDVSGAMSLAREAAEGASRHGDPALIARASCAAAFVHLTIGDLDAVAADVGACIAAARAARDPMRAVRARLLRAESDRRRGRLSSSASFIKRVRGMAPMHLPPIIRARADLVHALAEAPAAQADTAARHASRSGLVALSLYVAGANREQDAHLLIDSSAEGLIGILHLCQTAEDEGRVLANVCARLRKELHAASAAVFVGGRPGRQPRRRGWRATGRCDRRPRRHGWRHRRAAPCGRSSRVGRTRALRRLGDWRVCGAVAARHAVRSVASRRCADDGGHRRRPRRLSGHRTAVARRRARVGRPPRPHHPDVGAASRHRAGGACALCDPDRRGEWQRQRARREGDSPFEPQVGSAILHPQLRCAS